jgi:hypothetical protein
MTYLSGRAATGRNSTSFTFNEIQSILNSGRSITAGSYNDTQFTVGGHAYSVVSAFTNSSGQQIVRIRNPWGVDGRQANGDPNDGFIDLTFSEYVSSLQATFIEVA